MSESEYGLFEIFNIESSRVTTNYSGHGNILSITFECQFLNSWNIVESGIKHQKSNQIRSILNNKIVYVYW